MTVSRYLIAALYLTATISSVFLALKGEPVYRWPRVALAVSTTAWTIYYLAPFAGQIHGVLSRILHAPLAVSIIISAWARWWRIRSIGKE